MKGKFKWWWSSFPPISTNRTNTSHNNLHKNYFCNISSYGMLAYITKNYIALINYAKIVHLLCQFHAGKVGFSAVFQAYNNVVLAMTICLQP
jgi:hypothetical protein